MHLFMCLFFYFEENSAKSESGNQCSIWVENDDEFLAGKGELSVSVWVLTTTWGRYEDVVTIRFHVGTNVLPAIRIPLSIEAITFPIEFPLATNAHQPTVK